MGVEWGANPRNGGVCCGKVERTGNKWTSQWFKVISVEKQKDTKVKCNVYFYVACLLSTIIIGSHPNQNCLLSNRGVKSTSCG